MTDTVNEGRGADRVRSDLGRGHERVLEALARCQDFEDIEAAGFLFHGTCETLKGNLQGGGYDNVFWTAQAPNIAQAYIPRAGITMMVSEPSSYQRDDKLRPTKNPHDTIMKWAMKRAGIDSLDELDITWDGWKAYSFKIVPGWPTQGELDDHLRELGYEPSDYGAYSVSVGRDEFGEEEIKPADWQMPGHLLIALPRDMEVVSPEWSPEALGYRTHNRVGDFMKFAMDGIKAFRMEDKLQSEHWGNVNHLSVGITLTGMDSFDWIAIPATRHDGPDHDVWHYRYFFS